MVTETETNFKDVLVSHLAIFEEPLLLQKLDQSLFLISCATFMRHLQYFSQLLSHVRLCLFPHKLLKRNLKLRVFVFHLNFNFIYFY